VLGFEVSLALFWNCQLLIRPRTIWVLPLLSSNAPMFARIGIMRALNRNVVREFDSHRKDPHWGRRKLNRDMK
jgi:hypothetical protein